MTATTATYSTRLPFGLLAYLGAGISIGFCFAKVIALYALSVFGVVQTDFAVNPNVQAVLMWLFALGSVIGLALDRRGCASSVPLILGIGGLAIIIGTLYGHYYDLALVMGYVVLLVGAFFNQGLRLRQLNREVAAQADSLRTLNATLEQRVEAQVEEIENLGRLKRFLPPAVAELLVGGEADARLGHHRGHIAALFCDLRGFTAFTESHEPEEVMGVLGAYHEKLGQLAAAYGATIDHRAGDGLMLFFNDPIPCENPELLAVNLALEMQGAFDDLNQRWTRLDYNLGFGIGIASGYATMGIVGFEGRYDYTANGSAVNLAARLCDQADNGQILISQRVYVEVEPYVAARRAPDLQLKGVGAPVVAYWVDHRAQNTDP